MMISKATIALAGILALPYLASNASAQDRRTVKEPVIPPVCATVEARLVAVGDSTVAAADEGRLDTERIQAALDRCPRGRAVKLAPAGKAGAFLAGPLTLRAGVTLLVDRGAILFGSRDPRVYDLDKPGRCGTVDRTGHGCRPLIGGNNIAGAAVMGDGVIDGRGWAKPLGVDTSWWGLAEIARAGGSQNVPRIMHLVRANDFTLYRITLRNSANFHVMYSNGDGFTVWGVKVWSPEDARNSDGIDPQNSTNVTITRSFIHTGDDNVAIKAGGGPAANMTISHNHFYTGHGMSIGSETNGGVRAIRVSDLSIDGADNGLRIKSNETRGGIVRDVVYENVCIRNSPNPILMDTHYSFLNEAHGLVPDFRDVTLRNVRIAGKGKITLDGYDAARKLGIAFDGVTLEDASKIKVVAQHADVQLGPGPVNFMPAGEDVSVTGAPGMAKAAPCEGRFPEFPK